jgi:tetratricopeptide (TPR) repeat protein
MRHWHKLPTLLLLLPSLASAQLNHIETAAQLLSQGQVQQAETEARLALDNPSTRPLGLALLGTIRLQEGKYDESTTFLTQALALNPRLVGARTTLGNSYMLQGKPDSARKSFQEALRLDPTNFNARLDLAKVEASLHNYQQSLAVATPIANQLRDSDEGLLLLATVYGSLGKKDALKALVPSWERLPAPPDESSVEFGNTLALLGLTTEARKIFEAVETKTTANPSPPIALQLAQSYLSLGILDRAEQNFQRSLASNAACAPCEQGLAQIAEQQGDTEKALAHLIAAKRQAPEDPEILFQFGKICLQRNLPDDALPALTKAVQLKPDQDSYVYVLASANVAKNHLPEAASLFSQLLQKHPQDAVVKYSLGAVDFLQGNYDQAESSLKQSLKMEPDQVAASYYLALTYNAVGQDAQSIIVFRELLRRHPDHAPSYVKLGSILASQHQYDQAQPLLERAVALDPKSVQAHYQLGLLLRRVGKTEESDTHLAESRKLEAERSSQTDLKLRLLLPD